MMTEAISEATQTDYFTPWESVWKTDLLTIRKFILETRPKRITRYEIDEIIDPAGLRRDKYSSLYMAYVPDLNGEYRSDDMYCFLIAAKVLDEHSYTCVDTPKWILKHHKKAKEKFSSLTESWEINYHSEFFEIQTTENKTKHEMRIEQLENEVADLKQRLDQIEKVLFIEVTEVNHAGRITSPWKRK